MFFSDLELHPELFSIVFLKLIGLSKNSYTWNYIQ
jgi:hypothetical protein